MKHKHMQKFVDMNIQYKHYKNGIIDGRLR